MAKEQKPAKGVENLIAKHRANQEAAKAKSKGMSQQMLEWLGLKPKDK